MNIFTALFFLSVGRYMSGYALMRAICRGRAFRTLCLMLTHWHTFYGYTFNTVHYCKHNDTVQINSIQFSIPWSIFLNLELSVTILDESIRSICHIKLHLELKGGHLVFSQPSVWGRKQEKGHSQRQDFHRLREAHARNNREGFSLCSTEVTAERSLD